jgi:hypothetical protein
MAGSAFRTYFVPRVLAMAEDCKEDLTGHLSPEETTRIRHRRDTLLEIAGIVEADQSTYKDMLKEASDGEE